MIGVDLQYFPCLLVEEVYFRPITCFGSSTNQASGRFNLWGTTSGNSRSENERTEEYGHSDGQGIMEKWYNRRNDLGNQNVHEESLYVSLHWLKSTNFEYKIFIRGVEM